MFYCSDLAIARDWSPSISSDEEDELPIVNFDVKVVSFVFLIVLCIVLLCFIVAS